METLQPPYRKLILVCCHERDPAKRESCAAAYREAEGGSGFHILKALKEAQRGRNLKGKVRIAKSGCQDMCETGPTVSIWPEGKVYTGVTLADVPALIEAEMEPSH